MPWNHPPMPHFYSFHKVHLHFKICIDCMLSFVFIFIFIFLFGFVFFLVCLFSVILDLHVSSTSLHGFFWFLYQTRFIIYHPCFVVIHMRIGSKLCIEQWCLSTHDLIEVLVWVWNSRMIQYLNYYLRVFHVINPHINYIIYKVKKNEKDTSTIF